MNECKHENFECSGAVHRLTDIEDGPVTGYNVDLRVQCADCKEFFEFVGLPAGINTKEPTTSIDFTEARLPIRPHTGKLAETASYSLKKEEPHKGPLN